MNSHFNYELDERQIKLLMLDTETEYSEIAWDKFESVQFADLKSKKNYINYFPKINIGISRSIIIPILFIVSIGALSALLFSFVDFKKKPNELKEIPLVVYTPIKTPLKTITHEKTQQSSVIGLVSHSVTTAIAKKEIKTAVIPVTENKILNKTETIQTKENKPSLVSETSIALEKNNSPKHKKKKRKPKITSEELPTINTTNRLSESVSEPELKIN